MTPQEFFKKDLFAEQTGVELLEVREGYSKARLVITENHLNAGHRTQGGAIFTLADLALAAAANSHGTLAFSLSSNITFLRASGPGDLSAFYVSTKMFIEFFKKNILLMLINFFYGIQYTHCITIY